LGFLGIEHAKNRPDLTLGIVAFSTAQRDCILLEVERLRREHEETESFFTTERPDGESFFVKNLENVQGDERDIIYISIGYGKSAAGRLSQSFGPVNRDGGERRLNVLITRARLGMDVFCNFTADDLQTSGDTPFGVRSLKNFLKFAETGELEYRHETGRETDSPFEDEVISAIKSLGYDVEPQVGSAGFFIDIAVRDPSKLGRYALAVECDGASYHSSANARDRDRLRQDVLESLGWRFHRIWSTDWFRNPQSEAERLHSAIEAALTQYESPSEQVDLQTSPSNVTNRTRNTIARAESTSESEEISQPYTVLTS
jgi:very-short-patch-repair endonuclease